MPNRNKALLWTTLSFLSVAGAIIAWYFIWGQFEESTDDAYVHGNTVELNSQIHGIVTSINAEETQFVQKNQVVVELDRTDPTLALESSIAQLGENVREVIQMYETVKSLLAQVDVKKSEYIRARWDFENRAPLVESGAISKEEFEHTLTALEGSKAALIESKHNLLAAYALVQNTTIETHPLVQQAAEGVKEAYVNLRRCQILAPTDGFIAMRHVQVGESVEPTTPLLAIVPLEELWVEANYKEVHLKHVRMGQPVEMRADIWGHSFYYHGKVTGLSAGTGSAFAILPPQNATGNWIKIVQRLPVRIDLDPEQLKKFPLRIGLSMHSKIDTHDRSGPQLASARALKPIYSTDVYPEQLEGANQIVETVIRENSNPKLTQEIAQLTLPEDDE